MKCCEYDSITILFRVSFISFKLYLLFDWFGISCMTTDNFCFYLQNRLIQTSQTGGQRYCDASLFSIPWLYYTKHLSYSYFERNWLNSDKSFSNFTFQFCPRKNLKMFHFLVSYLVIKN